MRIENTFSVSRPREQVWQVFGDPALLASCVPGVETVDVVDERHYSADMVLRVTFMTLRFQVEGEMIEQDAPRHMAVDLTGEPVAFAGAFQASLTVDMEAKGGETLVTYAVEAHLTGRLASLGEALLNATAAQMGREFASNLKARVEAGAA